MNEWQIQIMIPNVPDTRLAEELPDKFLQGLEAEQQVRREIYHHLSRRHQGFFVSHEAAELVSDVATALLVMIGAIEGSGVSMPRELKVLLSQKADRGGNNSRVQPRSVSE